MVSRGSPSAPAALVVEDDPEARALLAAELTGLGLEPIHARGADEVLASIDARAIEIAVFALDLRPLDGLALMKAARGRRPDLPVLIVVPATQAKRRMDVLAEGAVDWLLRPLVAEEVRIRLSCGLAERARVRNRALLDALERSLGGAERTASRMQGLVDAARAAMAADAAGVFLVEKGRPVLLAGAEVGGDVGERLAEVALRAVEERQPSVVACAGRITAAMAVGVGSAVTGALVVERTGEHPPAAEELRPLALFASAVTFVLANERELVVLRAAALAALSRLGSQVAHELNNPLGGLKLYVRLLERSLAKGNPEESLGLAQKIGRAVDQIAELAAQIRSYDRAPMPERELTRGQAMLEDCLADCLTGSRQEGEGA